MSESKALSRFQERCHEIFTCYTFVKFGLWNVADRLRPLITGDEDLVTGTGHPDDGKAHSKMNMSEAVKNSERGGSFSDIVAKSLLVLIYSEWDELFRHRVAAEVGAPAMDVSSDLMGDLRLVRHWIVHNKSRIDSKCKKMKVLKWALSEGDELNVTDVMFADFIDSVNAMSVAIRS
jgi:hypothetical protein